MLEMLDTTIFWVWPVANFAVTSDLTLPGLAPAAPSVVPEVGTDKVARYLVRAPRYMENDDSALNVIQRKELHMNCKPLFILLATLYLTGCAAHSTAPDDGLTREQMKEIMDVPPELRSEWRLGKYEMPTKEEREKRLKIIKDWYDELVRPLESTKNNHVSTNEFKDSYVECMNAMVSLLSPKYQQRLSEIEASADPLFPNYILRLSEIEMSEELTQEEIDGITAELQAIREELGIPVDDFIQDTADELHTWMLFKNIPYVH